jgi:hypothetical protein
MQLESESPRLNIVRWRAGLLLHLGGLKTAGESFRGKHTFTMMANGRGDSKA